MARYRRPAAVVALGVLLTFSLALAPLVTAYDPLAGSADALLPPLTPGTWAPTTWGGMCGRSSSTGPASRWRWGSWRPSAPPSWGRPWGGGEVRRGLAGRGPDARAEFFQTLPAWCWP